MALTEHDKANLTEKQQQKILQATADWEAAKAAGDEEGMARASQQAATVRAVAGYVTDSYGNYTGAYTPTTTTTPTSSGGGVYTPSGGYSIGSEKGQSIANDMGIGQTYTASDGSVWKKNNDGTISVSHNGVYTENAYSPTDYSVLGQQQMEAGVDWRDVEKTYNARYNKATTTAGLSQYANDGIQQAMWDYIQEGKKAEGMAQYKQNASYWMDDYDNKPTYNSAYKSRIDKQLNEILKRDDFSYDVTKDPLYAQYAAMYQREGDRAIQETMSNAAASAGGMNSYAITAAQQAGNYYASQLGDKVPELYQLAYEMYLQDKASMVEDLGLLQSMDNTQYSRYRDTMDDFYKDKSFAYGMYQDAVEQGNWQTQFDYNAMVNDRDFASDNYWAEREWNAEQEQQAIENGRYDTQWENKVEGQEYDKATAEREEAKNDVRYYISLGVMPSEELIARAGMTVDEVKSAVKAVNPAWVDPTPSTATTGTTTGAGVVPESGSMPANSGGVTQAMVNGLFDDPPRDENGNIISSPKSGGVKADDLYPWDWGDGAEDSSGSAGSGKTGSGKTGSGSGSAGGGKTGSGTESEEETTGDLGLGLIYSPDLIVQLAEAGGIYEENGKLYWADGWNKDNFQDKLSESKPTFFR